MKTAGRNISKLTVSEILEYMRQLSENESENENDEEIVFSDDVYVPLDEKNISSDEDTLSNFPVQCTSRKTTSEKKKQCVNKRKKLSDSNLDEMKFGTYVTNHGTCGKSITSGSHMRGRIAEHNVFKEKSSPTSYAKQNIENSYAISSWRLLIDEPMLRHIKNCTQEEAHRQKGKNEWSTSSDELDAFISILYARGMYTANNLELDSLWSVVWGPHFFCDNMARDTFRELMKFLRFNKKTTRSERLQRDKLCFIFEV
ncbi:uncharacterized protein TNCV_4144411 [Trichonephila clavipes]|nr:uncharacterized protein TNCV_4144411 [Trichonephila clavipes]